MDGSDGSNNNNASNSGSPPPQRAPPPHPGNSSRAVRAELEAQRRATVERQRRYAPVAREQIGRVFGDITPAWYARLRLLTPVMYARVAEAGVLGLSVARDRPLGDGEARAVAEHAARGADRMALINWGLTGAALALTWRGRRTLRFPLWTPQVAMPPEGAYLRRAMWHGARYVAYSAALSVTLRAPLMAYNAMYEQQQMKADGRLRGLWEEQQGDAGFGDQRRGEADWGNEGSSYGGSSSGDGAQQQQQQQSIQEAAQTGWDTYKQAGQQQPPQQQYGQSTRSQSSAGWGGSSSWDSPDFDDASPVAASAQNNTASYGSGSSWDRLRQQSQQRAPLPPQQQQQQQQRPPPLQSTGGGGWGDSGDGADRAAQDKAQRDFDELVERDRQGQGQGRSGWGGR